MLQTMLGPETYFALVTAIALGFGRLLKSLAPQLPPSVLPWIVIGVAFGVAFGDQIAGGASLPAAFFGAAGGVLSGAIAVGAHEASKGLLVPIVGESAAEHVLGKLRGKP